MGASRCWAVAAAAGLACGGLGTGARGQAFWTNGAGNGDWHTAANWSTGIVPDHNYSVVIPQGFSGVSALGIGVISLTAESPLSVGGGGIVLLQGATIKDLTTTGGFGAGAPVVFTGMVNVQAANTWQATGGFRSAGEFNVAFMPLSQTAFTNDGMLRVENGNLTVGGTASSLINNGALELRSGGNLLSVGLVRNTATWKKVGATASEVQCRLEQAGGSLSVADGLLRLTGGGTYTAGPIDVELGATLRLEGPFAHPAHYFNGLPRISGGGELEVQIGGPAAVQVQEDLIVNMTGLNGMHMQSGSLMIAAGKRLRNQGKIWWEGGTFVGPGELLNESGASLTIPAGQSVPAQGNLEIRNAANLQILGFLTLNQATLINEVGRLCELTGELRAPNPAAGLVVNKGNLDCSTSPTGTVKIQARLEQRDDGATRVLGGTLSLQGGGEMGMGGGAFVAAGQDSVLAFDTGTFQVTAPGHIIVTAVSTQARFRGTGTVVNVQAGGDLRLTGDGAHYLEGGAQLGGPGTIRNRGVLYWNSRIGVNGAADFVNESSRGPEGWIFIPSGGASLRGSLSNTFGARLYQQGALDMATATLRNEGLWVVEPQTASQVTISGVGGLIDNQFEGLISAEAPAGAGRGASISTTLDNGGEVRAIGGVTLTISGQVVQLQNGVLTGGRWTTAEGGRIILPGVPPITKLKNASIRGSQQGMPWLTGVDEAEGAELHTNGDVEFTGPVGTQEGNIFRMGPGSQITVPTETRVGAPMESVLSFCDHVTVVTDGPQPPRLNTPLLTVNGGIRPGGPGAAGPFNLTGQLSMRPSGVAQVEIGGLVPEDEHDIITITGGADLDGTLEVRLLGGFVPQAGQTFTVLTATGPLSGTFAQIAQPPGLPGNVRFEAEYAPGLVRLRTVPACYANCDGSTTPPVLNVSDFICFLNSYAQGTGYANCDGSTTPPALNVSDFVCFQTRYAQACP